MLVSDILLSDRTLMAFALTQGMVSSSPFGHEGSPLQMAPIGETARKSAEQRHSQDFLRTLAAFLASRFYW